MKITREQLRRLIREEIRTLREGWIPDDPVLANPSPEGNYFKLVAFPRLSVENQSGTGWLDFLENSDPHLASQVRRSMRVLVREDEQSLSVVEDEDEAIMDLGYKGDYS